MHQRLTVTFGVRELSSFSEQCRFRRVFEGVGPEFHTYVEREKVRTFDGDIVVGADLPDAYELAPVPDVIITKYPKLKSYRYVRMGKRIAIISPSTRKVVRFID